MTGSRVLPAGTALLAHKRLRDVVEALARRAAGGTADIGLGDRGARPVSVRPLDRRVLALAEAALAQMGGGERVDLPATSPLAPGPGRFAILGTSGFDLAGYASVLGRDPEWITAVLRRGTPDPNRSHVVVGSTRLALLVGNRAVAGGEAAAGRAFAHGMLDAAATSVVAGPVLAGLLARQMTRDWGPLDPPLERKAAEARVLAMIGPDGGKRWTGFWPGPRQVPDALLSAYRQAVEEVGRFGAGRAVGFPSFEQRLSAAAGPLPTTAELKAAYALLRLDLNLSRWSAFQWWLFLLPLWTAPMLSLVLAREVLPAGASFFKEGPLPEGAATEVLTLAAGAASLTPFVWSLLLWSQVPDRTGLFVEALLLFLARAGLFVGFAATAGDRPGEGLRWGLLGPMLATDVYAAVRATIDFAGGRRFDGFVRMLQAIPSVTGLVTLGLAGLAKALDIKTLGEFWGYWTATTVIMLLAGVGIAVNSLEGSGLRDILLAGAGGGLRASDGLRAVTDPSVADPAAPASTFDVSTVWADGGAGVPSLGDLRYPSGTRPLIRVWWEGAGTLDIAHDRHTVTLRAAGADTAVELPAGDRTATALGASLEAAVAGVKTEVFDESVNPQLPWPATLADPGDDAASRAGHDAHAGDFTRVGTDRAHAHVIRHTPRSELATPMGLAGPVPAGVTGVPLVPGRALGDLEQTAIGNAADLAVLLHLGAAPWLDAVTPAVRPPLPALPALPRAYEVFRLWNLDHRLVNEWRMVVAGGAESVKGGHPERADPGMLPGRPGDSPVGDGAAVADAMGWVPAWRAWLRVASDVTADTEADVVMGYTPTVRRADGTSFRATNAQLSQAVRWLLDLP